MVADPHAGRMGGWKSSITESSRCDRCKAGEEARECSVADGMVDQYALHSRTTASSKDVLRISGRLQAAGSSILQLLRFPMHEPSVDRV